MGINRALNAYFRTSTPLYYGSSNFSKYATTSSRSQPLLQDSKLSGADHAAEWMGTAKVKLPLKNINQTPFMKKMTNCFAPHAVFAQLPSKVALSLCFGVLAASQSFAVDATIRSWDNGDGSNKWLTGASWTGDIVPTAAEVAQWGNVSGNQAGINFGITTNVAGGSNGNRIQEVGALQIANTRVNSLTIGNITGTAGAHGVLRLTGVTVNNIDNIIIRHLDDASLTIQNNTGGQTQNMKLELGNTTNNIVSIESSGNVNISSVVQGASRNLTVQGGGAGVLNLSGVNTYSGSTTVTGASNLTLSGSGSVLSTTSVAINGGTFLLSSAAADRINNAATVSLGGATDSIFRISGAVNEGVGALTLSGGVGKRVIDFGSTSGELTFASIAGAAASLPLQIWNWSAGGTDRFIATGGFTGANMALSNISFYSDGGDTPLGTA